MNRFESADMSINKPLMDFAQEPVDSGLVCLLLIAKYHQVLADATLLKHEFVQGIEKMGIKELVLAARSLMFKARIVKQSVSRLETIPYPAIAHMKNGEFILLARWSQDGLLVHEPISGTMLEMSVNDFTNNYTGHMVFIASRASLMAELGKFDFSWFIPAIIKYRKQLLETLTISLILQILALLTPLFFQVVTDKVLVNKTQATLHVLAIGLFIGYIFESLLTALRSYIFSHTTNRIDVELGSRLFHHLISLPISYFLSRRIGDSVARVHELENIRNFLTSNAITAIMDLLFSIVFICIMFFYSVTLTFIVIASLPLYVIVSLIYTPIIRARLQEKFNRTAENQSFLVESISGIETIKAGAVEPQWRKRWDNQLASYVHAGFKAMNSGLYAQTAVGLIGKIVTVVIMWWGATLVIAGDLTIGELIAFNMFAQHVAQPVLRLSQLWNDFQQIGIGMDRLGDILNAPTETVSTGIVLPNLDGNIRIQGVSFQYKPSMPDVLSNIDLEISAGEVVGIVGRSGSGKSTLTKLIQRLHIPTRGRILIDDIDLSTIDVTSLRRQVGVVLQENILFNRSIRQNIALSDPAAPIEKIIAAAKLAGAHDFISEMPQGYDTPVGELGSTLSGGQRQRIAIARALLSEPKILIFDEATSALDYESERAIQENMKKICVGRTVLIIAHRLSAVRQSSRIIVFDKGRIVESGSFQDLVAKNDGVFANLYRMQNV
jgi:ATP-binding cassette, subfamily B, bacterial HlyB/CyaB